eukprot:sb/3476003/
MASATAGDYGGGGPPPPAGYYGNYGGGYGNYHGPPYNMHTDTTTESPHKLPYPHQVPPPQKAPMEYPGQLKQIERQQNQFYNPHATPSTAGAYGGYNIPPNTIYNHQVRYCARFGSVGVVL